MSAAPQAESKHQELRRPKMHWIDHNFLPDICGTVDRFIVNRHGEVDGLVLMYEPDRFLFVHLPPHLGPQITSAVAPSDAVRVRGLRPRGADMIAAVAVIASDGRAIVDNGPDGKEEPKPQPRQEKARKIEAEGVVRISLFGPKGELRGALLDNGDCVRIGPKEAAPVAALLRPGATVAARGDGLESANGRVVTAAEIGPDLAHLRPVKDGKDKPKEKKAHAPNQSAAIGAE
jgi:hypothetical protein